MDTELLNDVKEEANAADTTERHKTITAVKPVDFPGKRLRQARESLGITVEDVATQMRLTTTLIEKLEADDYDAMPKQVFLRGYLRAYAKIVYLNADEVIEQFNALNLSDIDTGRPTWALTSTNVSRKERFNRFISFTLAASLF